MIAGFMTHLCGEFVAEGIFLSDQKPVVAVASASRPLESGIAPVSGEQLDESGPATIGDLSAL